MPLQSIGEDNTFVVRKRLADTIRETEEITTLTLSDTVTLELGPPVTTEETATEAYVYRKGRVLETGDPVALVIDPPSGIGQRVLAPLVGHSPWLDARVKPQKT